jgi:hypothetical protein
MSQSRTRRGDGFVCKLVPLKLISQGIAIADRGHGASSEEARGARDFQSLAHIPDRPWLAKVMLLSALKESECSGVDHHVYLDDSSASFTLSSIACMGTRADLPGFRRAKIASSFFTLTLHRLYVRNKWHIHQSFT